MQIQFPRRIRLGFRPWYGLTLRQLAYLVVTGIAAGAIVFFGPAVGGGLLVRVLIGLGIISIGVALAFFRKDGLTTEQWLVAQFKFWTHPQKRVWTRSDQAHGVARDQVAEIEIDRPQTDDGTEHDAAGTLLRPKIRTDSTASVVVIWIDMAMLFSLFALVVYLWRGGLGEIQGWFLSQVR